MALPSGQPFAELLTRVAWGFVGIFADALSAPFCGHGVGYEEENLVHGKKKHEMKDEMSDYSMGIYFGVIYLLSDEKEG